MKHRLRRPATLLAAMVVACGMSVGSATAKPHRSTNCVDHADHGTKGNGGDPGNGGNHHNESRGRGNAGDPGNGQGHFCHDV